MKKKLLIIVDYRKMLYSKINTINSYGIDLKLLIKLLKKKFKEIIIRGFDDNFDDISGRDWYILYQSSEDPGLYYKSYIEDIAYILSLKKTTLIPPYPCLKAHENKLFMYEYLFIFNKLRKYIIDFKNFGTIQDLIKNLNKINFPIVVKFSDGSGSNNVFYAKSKFQLMFIIFRKSLTISIYDCFADYVKRVFYNGYIGKSHNRKKFTIQKLVKNIDFDYKVIIYHNRYFILLRKNRTKDFRASGSGNFIFPKYANLEILNAASDIYKTLNVPYLSLDLLQNPNDKKIKLIELQFLMFGTLTVENSEFYYELIKNNKFIKKKNNLKLEQHISYSIENYIKTKK